MRSGALALGVLVLPLGACQRRAPTACPADAAPAPVVDAAPTPLAEVGACPVSHDLAPEVELHQLLDAGQRALAAQAPADAWLCADRAAALEPSAIEAHELRARALIALGRLDEASVALALALALDPEDAASLHASADFYINHGTASRDGLWLGLEYVRRGLAAIPAKQAGGDGQRAALTVLAAQAHNDLGQSDQALREADRALALAPSPAAAHERAVAAFNLGRFAEAVTGFTALIEAAPDNAFAFYWRGLAREWTADLALAEADLATARQLDPVQFPLPVVMSEVELRAIVETTIATLPDALRTLAATTPISIRDLPDLRDLNSTTPPFPPTVLGMYRAGALPGAPDLPTTPTIVLYRKNLLRAATNQADLVDQIRITVIHELGHAAGLDEDDLRRRGLE